MRKRLSILGLVSLFTINAAISAPAMTSTSPGVTIVQGGSSPSATSCPSGFEGCGYVNGGTGKKCVNEKLGYHCCSSDTGQYCNKGQGEECCWDKVLKQYNCCQSSCDSGQCSMASE